MKPISNVKQKKDEYPFRPFIEGANSTPLH